MYYVDTRPVLKVVHSYIVHSKLLQISHSFFNDVFVVPINCRV